MRYIDLRSDTVTRPTLAMRAAMAAAEVGDDVYGDDPTVNELEALAAETLGFEAALFVTSGTMGNQLGIMSQTRRGDEIIAGANSHIFMHEVGAAAVLSGVTVRQVDYPNCIPVPAMVEAAIRPDDIHEPPTSLICLENALANGRLVPVETMAEIRRIADEHGLNVHLDGARVFNAAAALGVDVKEITRYADSVSCCLSKGLCAPVGAIFAGRAETVKRARKCRKLLGGGMRQAGILAAAGILALKEMPKRLSEDHANAKRLAELLSQIDGVSIDKDSVEINMVFFKLDRSAELKAALPEKMKQHGILINPEELGEFRFVTNNDVSAKDVEFAAGTFASLL
ncbi:MAG: low-specificity L-threonine aldolase [Eubacteriales bacterium]|nr:low-specificity L-threonine aldolase [Eubacteriales bacterium]MCI6979523.1 low-specificity L-threonine aldolase [Clostridiales bacterium]MDD6721324.1 low-specificity L-threonine aldolase [Clostridiales bacterium]MDY5694327.1 low-specificity L-threonine aldolase [Eubacteriales bacterium]